MAKKRLTQWQYISLGVCYMMGTLLHTTFVSAAAGRDAWLMPLTGLAMFLPSLLMFIALSCMFPQTGLFDINERVFGKTGGRIVTFLYFLFFLHVAVLNSIEMASFSVAYLMMGTPVIASLLIIALTAVYAVKKGIITIGRASSSLVILLLALNFLYFLQAIPQMNVSYILPVMTQDAGVYIRSSHTEAAIMYGELLVLLTFNGLVGTKVDLRKCLLIVTVIAVVFMVLAHLRETMLLGPLTKYLMLPSYEAARITGNSVGVSRSESIFAMIALLCRFYKVVLPFVAALSALKKLFALKTFQALIVPGAVLLVMYSIFVEESPENSYLYGPNTAPFIWTVFVLVLPLMTFLTAHIKRRLSKPRKAQEDAA